MKTNLLSIGTDVECFARNEAGIVALRPGDIEGKKAEPFVINKTYDIGIQLDNVLAEITFAPTLAGNDFGELCYMAKVAAKRYLAERGLSPVFVSHHVFELEELNFTHAKIAGCEPDYAAIEDEDTPSFNESAFARLRTGSGHLHFGTKEPLEKSDVIQYVRGLDRCVGAVLCLLHNDPTRRMLYGQAGRFRYKPYGFEYRTPDNFWFNSSDALAPAIWNVAEELFTIDVRDPVWEKVNEQHKDMAEAINLGLIPEIEDMLDSFAFPYLDITTV